MLATSLDSYQYNDCLTNYVSYYSLDSYQYTDCLKNYVSCYSLDSYQYTDCLTNYVSYYSLDSYQYTDCLTNYVSYYSLDSYQYTDCLRVWSQIFGSRLRRVFAFGHHIHIDILWPFHPAFYSTHYSLFMIDFTMPSVSHDRAYVH